MPNQGPGTPLYKNWNTGYSGPWVDQLLTALGAPTSDSNRAVLRSWAAAEGTIGSNTPLAISGNHPGATTCLAQCGSSSPVMAYNNMQNGVNATAAFILGNNYSAVVNGLRGDADPGAIFNAINQSGWCKGCQGGHYPSPLYQALGGNPGTAVPPKGGGGQSAPAGVGINTPLGHITILNSAETLKFKGWFFMIAGGFVTIVGVAVVLASIGLESAAGRTVTNLLPGPAGQAVRVAGGERGAAREVRTQRQQRRRSAEREEQQQRRAGERLQLEQERGSQKRATEAARAARARPRTEAGAPSRSRPRRQPTAEEFQRRRAALSPEQREQVDTY